MATIVSHYSTAFLLAIMVPATMVMKTILRRRNLVLTASVGAIILTVTLTWYLFNADGAVIRQFVGMGDTALSTPTSTSVALNTGNPDFAAESHRLIAEGSANMPDSLRYMYLLTQCLIAIGAVIGFIWWLVRRDNDVSDEFMAFSVLFTGLLGLELVLPQFSLVISLDRIYLVCLILLAPFCIIGANVLGRLMTTVISNEFQKKNWPRLKPLFSFRETRHDDATVFKAFTLFLVMFLLANTGFLYELAGEPLATSIALSQNKADFPVFNDSEFAGARWLLDKIEANGHDHIYYDSITHHLFSYLDAVGEMTGKTAGQIIYRPQNNVAYVATDIPADSYIYYRSFNIREQKMALGWPAYQTMDIRRISLDSLGAFSRVLAQSDLVYDNGKSQVLYTLTLYNPGKESAKNDN
jgi:uncharacterized membrane protein